MLILPDTVESGDQLILFVVSERDAHVVVRRRTAQAGSFFLPDDALRATAARTSSFNAGASSVSAWRKSIARVAFASWPALK